MAATNEFASIVNPNESNQSMHERCLHSALLEPDKVPNRRSLYAFDGAPYALLDPNKLPNRRSLYAFDGAPYALRTA